MTLEHVEIRGKVNNFFQLRQCQCETSAVAIASCQVGTSNHNIATKPVNEHPPPSIYCQLWAYYCKQLITKCLSVVMTASQFTVFLVLVMLSCCNSETPAHVQSKYGQLVTSSTLTWVRSGLGMTLPSEAVSSGTGDGVICRGHVSGVLVSGFTSRSRCMVAGTGWDEPVIVHLSPRVNIEELKFENFNSLIYCDQWTETGHFR